MPHRGFAGELALVLLFGLVAVRGYFYDELDHHLPLTLEILRGHYPPPYPFLPGAPFRYHFGFDLLSAVVTRVSGLPAWYAFDVLTVLAVWALARLASGLAADSGVKGAAPLAGMLVLLGGGLAWVAFPVDVLRGGLDLGDAFARPFYHLEYEPWQTPPLAGYAFQHPMALGMPLWLALLRCWLASAGVDRWAVLAAVLLGALGLTQSSFFYLAFPVVLGGAVLRALLGRPLAVAQAAAVLALGALLHATGGPGGVPANGATVALRWPPHLGWPEADFPGYLACFGVPALVALAGAARAARARAEPALLFALAGAGAFVAPHLFVFKQSPWNSAKLLVAAQLSAALLAAPVLAAARPRALVALLLCASIASPLLFLWVRLLGPLGIDPALPPIAPMLLPPPAGGLERVAAAWLAARAAPGDVALAVSPHLTAFSGVPSFAPQESVTGWWDATDPDGSARAAHARAWDALDPAELDARAIAWVLWGPSERARAGAQARARLADPRLFRREFAVGEAGAAVELYRRLAPR